MSQQKNCNCIDIDSSICMCGVVSCVLCDKQHKCERNPLDTINTRGIETLIRNAIINPEDTISSPIFQYDRTRISQSTLNSHRAPSIQSCKTNKIV